MTLLPDNKKIYFASDFHLGVPDYDNSLVREKRLAAWLDSVKHDAAEIYLVGDLFDFWFEYKTVIPKYYTRLLGKLAELRDMDIPITFFTGNHDMWMFGYFEKELGIPVIRQPIDREINGVKFHIAHGDGLGPGDKGYKFIKKVFASKFCQWAFKWIHPDVGIGIANYFSHSSRKANGDRDYVFLGEENEWLVIYSKELLKNRHYDYMIYGHRHLPMDIELQPGSHYINLGDWIKHFTYAVFDGEAVELKEFTQ
ncbi:MAG TPA: UDP-2,3-diacylglucosamine diphosphatase [Bacteroidia bacterium]|nr:UDP-2,3-diacylglucosamine diphosphatase [Bacteroidia bacterium]